MMSEHKICKRCVLDTTASDLRFDENGVCQYCSIHDELQNDYPLDAGGDQKKFLAVVEKIKEVGKGHKYDIIVGVSGGRDSSYGLHQAIKVGLRPLAVHFDNGWNSEVAVSNIKKITQKLDVDLHTYVVDWEEFKDLQIAFLKASVSDVEIPTDVGIHSFLHRIAAQEGVKYILMAHSFRTEGFAPLSWTYMEGKYIKDVHKKFGTRKLKTYPNFTIIDFIYYQFLKGIKVVPFLAYLPYDAKEVAKMLEDEYGWEYYGGHHHESYYTHSMQSYYLPKKFNIDKRKIEYSALVRSGQMTREQALEELKTPYPYQQELVDYTVRKLGLSKEEFDEIMSTECKTFLDYSTYYPLMRKLKWPIKMASKLNLIPKYLYLRYFG